MLTNIGSLNTAAAAAAAAVVVPTKYRVTLQIKHNGKAASSLWTRFNFVVEKQMLIVYDDDPMVDRDGRADDDTIDHHSPLHHHHHQPKGMINLVGCKAFKCDSSPFSSQGKLFVFKLISAGLSSSSSSSRMVSPSSSSSSSSCQYLFSAPSEQLREKTVVILNFASIDPYWFDPFSDVTLTNTNGAGVDQRMPSSSSSSTAAHIPATTTATAAAARIIVSLFRMRVALSRRHALQSQLPSIYMLQINEVVMTTTDDHHHHHYTKGGGGSILSGSVRGLIAAKNNRKIIQLSQRPASSQQTALKSHLHPKLSDLTSICITNVLIIPTLPSSSSPSSSTSTDSKSRQTSSAIAMVTCDSAVTCLSLDLQYVLKANKKQPLGRVRTHVLSNRCDIDATHK